MSVGRENVPFPRDTSKKLHFSQGRSVAIGYGSTLVVVDEKDNQCSVLANASHVHALVKSPSQDHFVSVSLQRVAAQPEPLLDEKGSVNKGKTYFADLNHLKQRQKAASLPDSIICTVQCWDLATRTALKGFQFQFDSRLYQPHAIESLQMTPDGKHIVGVLCFWDPKDLPKKATIKSTVFAAHLETGATQVFAEITRGMSICSLTLLSNNRLAILTQKEGLKLYRISTCKNQLAFDLFYPNKKDTNFYLSYRTAYDLVELDNGKTWYVNFENSKLRSFRLPVENAQVTDDAFVVGLRKISTNPNGIPGSTREKIRSLLIELLGEIATLEKKLKKKRALRFSDQKRYTNVHMGVTPLDIGSQLTGLSTEIEKKKNGVAALMELHQRMFKRSQSDLSAVLTEIKKKYPNVCDSGISRRVYNVFVDIGTAISRMSSPRLLPLNAGFGPAFFGLPRMPSGSDAKSQRGSPPSPSAVSAASAVASSMTQPEETAVMHDPLNIMQKHF